MDEPSGCIFSSVLTFGITCCKWKYITTRCDRLNRIIIKASDVIGQSQDNIDQLLEKRTHKKIDKILKDTTHPLYENFDALKITRSGRFRLPKIRTNRYRDSFLL